MNPWVYEVFVLHLNTLVLAPFIFLRLWYTLWFPVIFTVCIIIKKCGESPTYIFIHLHIAACLLVCLAKKNIKHRIVPGDAPFYTYQSINVET